MIAIEEHINVLTDQFQDIVKKQKKETKLSPKLQQARMKKDLDVLLKRKHMLEIGLFSKKYERVLKHISGVSAGDAKMNPFTQPHKPSVYSENLEDPKMKIRANAELYENVIKSSKKAFSSAAKDKFLNMSED